MVFFLNIKEYDHIQWQIKGAADLLPNSMQQYWYEYQVACS